MPITSCHASRAAVRLARRDSAMAIVVRVGVGMALLACATGCVSTGSFHASLGQRGIEASRIHAPATARATDRGTVESFSVRLARAESAE